MEKLELTTQTLNVLKNFSSINPTLLFRPGNKLVTVSPGNTDTILGVATVDNEFKSEFAINDLNALLRALSLFDRPVLVIGEKSLTIVSKTAKLDYRFADTAHIDIPPKGKVKIPPAVAEFELSAQSLGDVLKAAQSLSLPHVVIKGEDGKVFIRVTDMTDSSANVYDLDVNATTSNTFSAVINIENIKIMGLTYNVSVCEGAVFFVNPTMTYAIVLEQISEFNGVSLENTEDE